MGMRTMAERAWLVAAVWGLGAGVAVADTTLLDAVKGGDRSAVRALLKTKPPVNAPEKDGTTALHWAIRGDDREMVRLLLDAAADVNAANRYGITPLSLAAANGSREVVQMLLAAGANPNAALPGSGETILMTAARTGDVHVVRALLQHGAAVDGRESVYGENALMWAAHENHGEVVRLLIEAGSEANARSAPTAFARKQLGQSVLPLGSWTPLMYAARQNATTAVKALVEGGADVNLTDPNGTTALVLAIINTHYDLAAYLLDQGADPDIADTTGMAALYAAVDMHTLGWAHGRAAPAPPLPNQLDSVALVRLLLERGADPNAPLNRPKLQRQHTPGDPGLGAGSTPLMRAAKTGDTTVMRVLLDYGADPALRQKDQTTLLMLAAGEGWRGGFDTSRDSGTEDEAIAAVALCLELGLDINAANEDGQTAVFSAIRRGDRVLKFLIDRGARLDIKDARGRTPLDLALSFRDRSEGTSTYPGAVAVLRAAGAPTTARQR
jgi:ankyrin repeat protein